MPITVTAPEGVLDAAAQQVILPRLSEMLLAHHGLTGNSFMTPAVVGSLNILPVTHLFAGSKSASVVFVELKVPASTFQTQDQRQGFITDATDLVGELTRNTIPREQIFVNIVYAVDGAWGIGGHAYTNAEMGEAITRAAASA